MKGFSFFAQLLANFRWQDLLDVFLVYLIAFRLLLLIRGTRAVQILTGLGLIAVAFILSDRLQLFVLNYLLKQFFDYLFLIVVILFQDEIRRALATMGRNPFGTKSAKSKAVFVLDEIAKAANILAAKRTGALIAIERQHGLKNYTDGATLLNAEVTAELLVSIFQNSSPIHDGAVVIQNSKILAAGCFVPVTLETELDRNLGTRHRAAVGLTRETDAVVMVVSEERGEISFVEYGNIARALGSIEMKRKLYEAFDLETELETNEEAEETVQHGHS